MSQMSIIQPNEITNARYEFTALQKNIIYLVLKQLQQHMSKDGVLNRDLFNNFVVPIPVSLLAGHKNHSKVIDAAKELMTSPLEYQYQHDTKRYTVATVLVHTAKHEHGSDTVDITVPYEALALLLHIGKGFTIYQLPIAMNLRSKHSKRMYELVCRWKDRGGFTMELQEFKQMLSVENNYKDVSSLRTYVLDVAKEELKHSADVWFDYSLEKVKSRSFNYINFVIQHNNLKDKNADKGLYPNVYNALTIAFPSFINDRAMTTTDRLADNYQLGALWNKLRPLIVKFNSGEMSQRHYLNTVQMILREDFNMD